MLYILQLFHDGSLGDASVTSITEYLLTQPIYSFVVSGHTPISPREGSDSADEGEEEEEEEEKAAVKEFDSRRSVVLIQVHCIQSRYKYMSCVHVIWSHSHYLIPVLHIIVLASHSKLCVCVCVCVCV